jgi:hypothetical protein
MHERLMNPEECLAEERRSLREAIVLAVAGGVAGQHAGFPLTDPSREVRAERFADEVIRFTDALLHRLDRENAPKPPEELAS